MLLVCVSSLMQSRVEYNRMQSECFEWHSQNRHWLSLDKFKRTENGEAAGGKATSPNGYCLIEIGFRSWSSGCPLRVSVVESLGRWEPRSLKVSTLYCWEAFLRRTIENLHKQKLEQPSSWESPGERPRGAGGRLPRWPVGCFTQTATIILSVLSSGSIGIVLIRSDSGGLGPTYGHWMIVQLSLSVRCVWHS